MPTCGMRRASWGVWLRSRNLIQVVGKNLFVHAGLSKEFTGMGNAVTEVNEEMARSIFLPKKNGRSCLPCLIPSIVIGDLFGSEEW